MTSEGLSRKERLRHRRDFERAYRLGRRVKLPYLILVLAPNEMGRRRMGLSVSRKVGKAVRRNRAKRILREIFRRNKALFPEGHDVIFIPKASFLRCPQAQVLEDLKKALSEKR